MTRNSVPMVVNETKMQIGILFVQMKRHQKTHSDETSILVSNTPIFLLAQFDYQILQDQKLQCPYLLREFYIVC